MSSTGCRATNTVTAKATIQIATVALPGAAADAPQHQRSQSEGSELGQSGQAAATPRAGAELSVSRQSTTAAETSASLLFELSVNSVNG